MERISKKINTVMVVMLVAAVFWLTLKRTPGSFTPDASAQVTLMAEETGLSANIQSATWTQGDWNGDGIIDGERFEILSFRHGLMRQAGERGPAFDGFVITKEVDKSSPMLAKAAAENIVISSLEIETTATYGGFVQPRPYLSYVMSDVIVTSYNIRGGSSVGNVPVEEIAFKFDKISVSYTEYDNAGNPLGVTEFTWPAEHNEP